MSGSTTSGSVTPATMEATLSGAVTDSAISNPAPGAVLGSATQSNSSGAAEEAIPPYGLDATSSLEKTDGTTTTLGDTLAAVDANTAKTADLSTDGSKYTGDVSGASFTSTDGKTTDTGAGVLQRAVDNRTAITATEAKTADLSADGSEYTGDVSNASITYSGEQGQPTNILLTQQFQTSAAFQKETATTQAALKLQVSKLTADGNTFMGDVTGDVSGATGGVTKVAGPSPISAAPTAADFNDLVTRLKTAGVFS